MATATALIGVVSAVLGPGLGESGHALLRTIPDAVSDALLPFSGVELLMAATGVARNPRTAFAVGLPLARALKRERRRI